MPATDDWQVAGLMRMEDWTGSPLSESPMEMQGITEPERLALATAKVFPRLGARGPH